ncbi:MAG: cell division protein SepF [Nanoarchaeota archaeon]|nr:cell division protein SepF [Nanoarchaeota archaeon]
MGWFSRSKEEEFGDDYVEIDLGQESKKSKIKVRPFVLKSFEGVPEILNALREGYTIAVVDIKLLKQKDVIELKRAITKIKKTTDALEGTIAGFGENTIIATPQFAEITKGPTHMESSHVHSDGVEIEPQDNVETFD